MVGRAGFEPTKAEPADLQSAPVDRLGTSPKARALCACHLVVSRYFHNGAKMVPAARIELATFALQVRCSTY